jgi:hypothetical protein
MPSTPMMTNMAKRRVDFSSMSASVPVRLRLPVLSIIRKTHGILYGGFG